MESSEKHAKHLVRQYMAARLAARSAERAPLPSIEEIRRQLGWDLIVRGASKQTLAAYEAKDA